METTSRDGFSGNKLEYYKSFLDTISNSSLLIAYKDDKAIAS
jgi:lipid II:glycine glycyltransferase (peptidoglycan interpeptide bridge formation enzyme)